MRYDKTILSLQAHQSWPLHPHNRTYRYLFNKLRRANKNITLGWFGLVKKKYTHSVCYTGTNGKSIVVKKKKKKNEVNVLRLLGVYRLITFQDWKFEKYLSATVENKELGRNVAANQTKFVLRITRDGTAADIERSLTRIFFFYFRKSREKQRTETFRRAHDMCARSETGHVVSSSESFLITIAKRVRSRRGGGGEKLCFPVRVYTTYIL